MRQVVSFAFALLFLAAVARGETPTTSVTIAGASFAAAQLTGPNVRAVLPWGGHGLGARMMLPLDTFGDHWGQVK